MTYQVLARKWRPQDFSSLVGQEHVVTALGNGLAENRIAQAYLFSGIRGVGKTTAARVLAKALNCERGPAANPCNVCDSCREITGGNSLDVIEVDAATYSKVEQVRELTESLRYGPARGRYKVVVLDEVHRLSRQAFDALLKIVEEPPAHLVFIFATTEIDSVPATILSRCQEFQFRRVPSPVLALHLRTICDAESITASDAALRMIARAGEGSVRDSVALLDQMATFGSGAISDDDAQKLLGGLDTTIFQNLIGAILEGRGADIVAVVHEIDVNGWDPHNVYAQFLSFSRDALHLAMGGDGSALDLPEEEATRLSEKVKATGYEPLLQVLQLLLESEPTVRRSEFSLLALEIAWLRASELPKVIRIQDLLSSGPGGLPGGGNGGGNEGGNDGGNKAGGGSRQSSSRDTTLSSASGSSAGGGVRSAVTRPSAKTLAGDRAPKSCDPARLPVFLEVLATRRQSLAAHLEKASLRIDRRTLFIAPPVDDPLLGKALERQGNADALGDALLKVWGEGVSWRIETGSSFDRAASDAGASDHDASDPAETHQASRNPPVKASTWSGESPEPRGPSSSFYDEPSGHLEPPEWTSRQGSNGSSPHSIDAISNAAISNAAISNAAISNAAISNAAISNAEIAAVSDLPVIRSVLEIFGGKIQRIDPANEEISP